MVMQLKGFPEFELHVCVGSRIYQFMFATMTDVVARLWHCPKQLVCSPKSHPSNHVNCESWSGG